MHSMISVAVLGALVLAGSTVLAQDVQNIQIIQRPAPGQPPRDPTLPEKTGTARLRGRVIAEEGGAPIRRVQLRLTGPEIRQPRMTSTDANGRYEFKDLPAGRYNLNASKAGFVSWDYGQRRAFERGKLIELSDAQTLERVDISLPRGSVITGRVVDEFGDPIAEATVSAMRYRFINGRRRLVPAGRSDQTDDIGQYRLFGLSPGEYYVSAAVRTGGLMMESDVRAGYAPTYYPGTANVAEAERVTLRLGQELNTGDLSLSPARMARISGTALDSGGRPATNALVMLRQDLSSGDEGMVMFMGGGGRVGPDGSFSLSNVAPGEYVLEVRPMGGPRQGERAGLRQEFASVPISVAGEDIVGLTITTGRGATAKGVVVTEDGGVPTLKPDTLRPMAQPFDGQPMMAINTELPVVEDDWTFQIDGLVGKRLIRLAGLPAGWSLKSVHFEGADITDTPIEFSGTETVEGIEVVITQKTTDVSGAVTDDRGRAVKEFSVIVFSTDEGRWLLPNSRFVRMSRPDQSGLFKIPGLPPADYLAVAVDYVPEGEWNNPEFLGQMKAEATKFTLGEGETKALDLKLKTVP
jgi:protocatechuate 3,4-dioxygenase beta subunit